MISKKRRIFRFYHVITIFFIFLCINSWGGRFEPKMSLLETTGGLDIANNINNDADNDAIIIYLVNRADQHDSPEESIKAKDNARKNLPPTE